LREIGVGHKNRELITMKSHTETTDDKRTVERWENEGGKCVSCDEAGEHHSVLT